MFRTELLLDKEFLPIDRMSKFLFLGSCFSQNIGEKLRFCRLETAINPMGIAFNPMSIADHIENICDTDDLVKNNGRWHSLRHHSIMSDQSNERVQENIKNASLELKKKLKNSSLLTLSFGTSIAYRHKKNGIICANCHQLPKNDFEKEILDINEMHDRYSVIFSHLHSQNPNLRILITVSPIRHIRDGIVLNNRSKARLIELSHSLSEENDRVNYFPSYELLMDDLRDYRFYERDRIHPNAEAIDYIWSKWKGKYCDVEFSKYLDEVQAFEEKCLHIPRNKHGELFEKYENWKNLELEKMKTKYPENYPSS